MNSERPSDRVPELTRPEFIVLGENLDSFGQSVSFHRHAEARGQVVDVDPAVSGREGCF
jgi:hypothetical protein